METEKIYRLLDEADWKTIILRLTRYAFFVSVKYYWNSGKAGHLSEGKTPEDIACDAVVKVFNGTRAWDPDKYPNLLKHLEWIVKSDIEHLFSSSEHKMTAKALRRRNDGDDQSDCMEDLPETSFVHPGKIPSPERGLSDEEDKSSADSLLKDLNKKIERDEDLEFLLMCLEEGFDKPSRIAEQMGWDIAKVYNLKRKLSRKATDIIKNRRNGE
jgi:hypothetical protein